MASAIEFRTLDRGDVSRVSEIDRSERIEVRYTQQGSHLVARHVRSDALEWDPHGHGEHSVWAQARTLERYLDAGGVAIGAFAGGSLVGVAVVVPHLRPALSQLAYLHVSAPFRATGIGSRLSEQVEEVARAAGDTEMDHTTTNHDLTVRVFTAAPSTGSELVSSRGSTRRALGSA